jgi:hypothetical protein
MRFLSAVQHGVYAEPESQVTADSDHSDSESDDDIVAEQNIHIRHAAIDVPSTTSPFHTVQAFEVFRLALQETQERGIIPLGYGVTKDEWTGGSYPEIELITVGRGKWEYAVELPFEVWWTRSVLWAQGLDIMLRICMMENGEL